MKKQFKREAYKIVKKAIGNNTIPVIFGLRRIGKTTILEQLEAEYDNSLYMDWSKINNKESSVKDFYAKIEKLASKHSLLLFDEVQVFDNWNDIIFSLYNHYTAKGKCNFVVTGSSLLMKPKKLGLDRVDRIYLDTLSYDEYLNFTKNKKSFANFEFFFGRGFPDYVNYDFDKYGYENIIGKVLKQIVFEDLLYDHPIINKVNMWNLLKHLGQRSLGIINETAIANELELDKNTVSNYIDIFEKAHVLKKIYRVNQEGKLGRKKRYKVYLNPHFYIWLNAMNLGQIKKFKPEILGHIIESYWIHRKTSIENNAKTYYFLEDKSNKNKEVDFVTLFGQENTFKETHELKYKESFTSSDFNHMFRIKADKAYIWTKDTKQKHNTFIHKSILDL